MRKIIFVLCAAIICFAGVVSGNLYTYAAGDYIIDIYGPSRDQVRQTLATYVYGAENYANSIFTTGLRVDRTAGSEKELAAANYLYEELKTILDVPDTPDQTTNEIIMQSFKFNTGLTSSADSQNVIGLLKAPVASSDFVLIGAHYDNYYGYASGLIGNSAAETHGIYDNASGVTALLETAKVLKQNVNKLTCNVMFVLYGAEEIGMAGSRYFYSALSESYKNSLLLAINFDSIGAGDEMYMYADEVETLHQKYFKTIADHLYFQDKTNNTFYNLPPANKKVAYNTGYGNMSYSHMGLASDNMVFVQNGVNSITFFSGDWDNKNLGMHESSTNSNISHTKKDNLVDVEKLYGDVFYQRISSVVNLTCNVVFQQDFVDVMKQSQEQKTKYLFFTNSTYIKVILGAVIVVVWAIIFFNTRRKIEKTVDPKLEQLREAVLNNTMSELNADITVSTKVVTKQTNIPEDVPVVEIAPQENNQQETKVDKPKRTNTTTTKTSTTKTSTKSASTKTTTKKSTKTSTKKDDKTSE